MQRSRARRRGRVVQGQTVQAVFEDRLDVAIRPRAGGDRPGAGGVKPLGPMLLRQAQDAQARAIALFGMLSRPRGRCSAFHNQRVIKGIRRSRDSAEGNLPTGRYGRWSHCARVDRFQISNGGPRTRKQLTESAAPPMSCNRLFWLLALLRAASAEGNTLGRSLTAPVTTRQRRVRQRNADSPGI